MATKGLFNRSVLCEERGDGLGAGFELVQQVVGGGVWWADILAVIEGLRDTVSQRIGQYVVLVVEAVGGDRERLVPVELQLTSWSIASSHLPNRRLINGMVNSTLLRVDSGGLEHVPVLPRELVLLVVKPIKLLSKTGRRPVVLRLGNLGTVQSWKS